MTIPKPKTILMAAATLVLAVALSSSQFVGSAFAAIAATGTCSAPNQQTGAKTCTGSVTGLQPATTTCTVEIKKNAQTGQIISQTGPTCGSPQGGDTGTVSGTITEQVAFTCFNSQGHPTGQSGTQSVQFTATSGTVSGGTQTTTETTTRTVGQGGGSQGPGTTTTETGPVTGAVTSFTLSGAPDLSGLSLTCNPNPNAGFTAQITSITNTGETFTFVPA